MTKLMNRRDVLRILTLATAAPVMPVVFGQSEIQKNGPYTYAATSAGPWFITFDTQFDWSVPPVVRVPKFELGFEKNPGTPDRLLPKTTTVHELLSSTGFIDRDIPALQYQAVEWLEINHRDTPGMFDHKLTVLTLRIEGSITHIRSDFWTFYINGELADFNGANIKNTELSPAKDRLKVKLAAGEGSWVLPNSS